MEGDSVITSLPEEKLDSLNIEDPNKRFDNDEYRLLEAVRNNQFEKVEELLSNSEIDLNYTDIDFPYSPPICQAAYYDYLEILKLILDPKHRSRLELGKTCAAENGFSKKYNALHCAIAAGNTECYQELMGVSIPEENQPMTVLEHLVASTGDLDTVETLLKDKNTSLETIYYKTIIHAACLGGLLNEDILKILLLDYRVQNESIPVVLHLCAEYFGTYSDEIENESDEKKTVIKFRKKATKKGKREKVVQVQAIEEEVTTEKSSSDENTRNDDDDTSKFILYMQNQDFYQQCQNYIEKLYLKTETEEAAVYADYNLWIARLSRIVVNDNPEEIEDLFRDKCLLKLYRMTDDDFDNVYELITTENDISLTIHVKTDDDGKVIFPKMKRFEDSCFESFYKKFPMLCVLFGSFKVLQKYFDRTIWHDSLPHAAFIIKQLRKVLKKGEILSEIQKENLKKTLVRIDERMTSLFEKVMTSEKINSEIAKSYLDVQFLYLQNRSIMDMCAENEVAKFLQSDFSIKAVERSWKGKGKGEKIGTKTKRFFMWFAYLPLLLFTTLVTFFSIIPAFLERLCLCNCRSKVEDEPTNNQKHIKDKEGKNTKEQKTETTEESHTIKLSEYVGKLELKTLKAHKVLKSKVKQFREMAFLPVVKFVMDAVSYMVFIVALSLFAVNGIRYQVTPHEIVLIVYLICLALEEMRQIKHAIKTIGFVDYFDAWNVIDCFGLLTLSVGLAVKNSAVYYRQTLPWKCNATTHFHTSTHLLSNASKLCLLQETNDHWLYAARIIMVISVILYSIKFLRISSVFQTLGPTLKMMADMTVTDLFPFLFIIFVFVFAFGTAFTALTFPNAITKENFARNYSTIDFQSFSISKGFVFAFYGLVGQYQILDLTDNQGNKENDELANHGTPHAWSRYVISYALLPIYITIVNIMLLNLLIALFGNTVNKIEEQSKVYWHISKYQLARDYYSRSVLPPPLNVTDVVYDFLKKICRFLEHDDYDSFRRTRAGKKKVLSLVFSYIQAKAKAKETGSKADLSDTGNYSTEENLNLLHQISELRKELRECKTQNEEMKLAMEKSEERILKAIRESLEARK